ncbi:MAG: SDR family oxidoreductase [Nitrososphaerota archaeon]|nr:SDR family oxidoreductase [Nitrososphaerota archaeon]MDG6923087.1 SDR family oxidoreductase [Nitrososphaerota archaeon]
MPKAGKLQGRVAIVTGSTSGVGRATAQLFAQEGANIVIVGRHEEAGLQTQREIESENKDQVFFVKTDVTSEDSVRNLINRSVGKFGRLDILVNNVGGFRFDTVEDMSLDDWNFVFNGNLTSVFLCSKYAIPHLAKSGKGVVLNTSSPAAFNALAMRSAYCCAKSGVILFTKILATENYGKHIRANCIVPGFVRGGESTFNNIVLPKENLDRMLKGFLGGHDNPGNCSPEDVAKLSLYLVSDDSYYINGTSFVMDGGMSSLTDYVTYEKDLKKLKSILKGKSK